MPAHIDSAHQITAEWLTSAMIGSKALQSGTIERVDVNTMDTNTAHAFPLRVTYSADATGTLPQRLFLKVGRRYSETAFWQHIAPRTSGIPLATCYYASFADEIGQSNLIFDDISDKYTEHPDRHLASETELMRYMEILATLHRQWWEHDDLRADGRLNQHIDNVPTFIQHHVTPQLGDFFDTLGDDISAQQRNIYEAIIKALPLADDTARLTHHDRITLVHGDAHVWNFAKPLSPEDDYLLQDWAVWHLNTPAYDLAYMITVRCPSDYRAKYERKAIAHYVDHLNITGYDFAQCLADYRRSTIFHCLWPIFWHKFAPRSIWFDAFSCLMSAFDDLDCQDFIAF